jgi:hypothetical protein
MIGMLARSSNREAIAAEIDRVRSLGLDELRTLWRTTLRSSPPPAFTKDLVARFLCWHIQEQALGGLDPETAKLLDRLARGDKPRADTARRLKLGTVLVREYQGERHTVTVGPDGYVWRETTYASLSTIARAITGTAWSGPRFFGLRGGVNCREDIEGEEAGTHAGSTDAGRSRRRGGSVSPLAAKAQR